MPVFQSVRDEDLIRGIQSATTRVVFFAPGVSEVVAKALIASMHAGRFEQMINLESVFRIRSPKCFENGDPRKVRIFILRIQTQRFS